jgi:DNA repair protein RAD7
VAATRAEASSSAPTAAEASSSAPTPPTAAEASTSTEQLTERTHRLRLSSHSRLATASGSKKRKKEDSDDSSDSDDDVFMPEGASRPRSNPGVSVVFCGTCKRRFTRRAHQTVDTCLTCLSGDPKKPAAKRKKVITRINKNVQKTQRVPSLQDVCIGVIAENIEDVESFGFIGDDSLGKLSKIISKNRKMSSEISRLFMEPLTRQLHLYDCTGKKIG